AFFSISSLESMMSILPSRISIPPLRMIARSDISALTRGLFGPASVTSCDAWRTASVFNFATCLTTGKEHPIGSGKDRQRETGGNETRSLQEQLQVTISSP